MADTNKWEVPEKHTHTHRENTESKTYANHKIDKTNISTRQNEQKSMLEKWYGDVPTFLKEKGNTLPLTDQFRMMPKRQHQQVF